MVKFTL